MAFDDPAKAFRVPSNVGFLALGYAGVAVERDEGTILVVADDQLAGWAFRTLEWENRSACDPHTLTGQARTGPHDAAQHSTHLAREQERRQPDTRIVVFDGADTRSRFR
jgi:hypothetical protein